MVPCPIDQRFAFASQPDFPRFYRPSTDQLSRISISTTKHRLHTILIANHTPHTQTIIPSHQTLRSESIPSGGRCNIPVAYNHQPFFSLSPKNDPLSFPFIRQCILTCSLSFPVVFPFISAFLALTWFFPKTVVFASPKLCPFALSSHSTNIRFNNNTTTTSKQAIQTTRP